MAEVRALGAQELKTWREGGSDYVLLDVRQPEEIALASVPGAVEIPMREVQLRVREIPRGKPVVVMCHLGDRSSRIARFLVTDGYQEVYNLEGGIDAYALVVDQAVQRY
jgi:rhodanese-related sulfurtransferase